jgi:hypothetical protein
VQLPYVVISRLRLRDTKTEFPKALSDIADRSCDQPFGRISIKCLTAAADPWGDCCAHSTYSLDERLMKAQTRILTLTAAAVLLSLAATLPALAQDLTANPSSLAFGDVYVGVPSGSKVLTITNVSGGGITINSIGFDCAGYGIASGVAPFSFGLTQTITHYSIFLAPTAAQNYNCNFIMSMSDGTKVEVPLTGTGVVSTGNSNLNKTAFTFPNQKIGSTSAGQTVTISNTGTGAITLTGITLSPPSFTTNNITLPANIAAGGTLPVTVYYTPSGVESETGALDLTYTQVIDNGVTLNGNGIAPTSLVVSSPPALPQATVSGAYETTLAANGGSGSYTWALSSGSLPSGLAYRVPAKSAVRSRPR